MKKVEKWEDLDNFKNNRGLSLIAREFDGNVKFFNCYLIDDEDDETCILLGTFYKNNLTNVIKEIYKYGFGTGYKEPFNLVDFLRENIKPKKFEFSKGNYYFVTQKETVRFNCESVNETVGTYYFELMSTVYSVENTLFKNKITSTQLISAMKKLGWL